MLKKIFIALSLAAVTSPALASEYNQDVTPFFEFLKQNVIGRAVSLASDPCVGPIPGTDIRCEFSGVITYTHLIRTVQGLKFQSMSMIKQTNYVPQADGSVRTENKDRQSASECEFQVLKSPEAKGRMFGFCRQIASTIFDPIGYFSAAELSIEGDTLVSKIRTGHFYDAYYNSDSGYRIASSEDTEYRRLEGGKLVFISDTQKYFYDEQGVRFVAGEPERYVYKEK